MKFCPKCNSEYNDKYLFCRLDGETLVEKEGQRLAHQETVDVQKKAFQANEPVEKSVIAEPVSASAEPSQHPTSGSLKRASVQDPFVAAKIAVIRETLEASPDNESKWVELGQSFKEIGDYNEAAKALEEVKRLNPKNLVAAGELADLYRQTGRPQKGFKLLCGLFVTNPENVEIKNALLSKNYVLELYPESVFELAKLALKYQLESEIYPAVGVACFEKRDYANTIRFLQGALELGNNDSSVLETLARALEQTGKVEEAKEIYSRLLSQDQSSPYAKRALGIKMLAEGNNPEAYKYLSEIENHPNFIQDSVVQLGALLAALRVYGVEGYGRQIKRAISFEPTSSDEQKIIGEICTLSGKFYAEKRLYEEAENFLERAFSLGGNGDVKNVLGSVYFHRAASMEERGNLDAAVQLLEKAVESDPDNSSYAERKAALEKTSVGLLTHKRRLMLKYGIGAASGLILLLIITITLFYRIGSQPNIKEPVEPPIVQPPIIGETEELPPIEHFPLPVPGPGRPEIVKPPSIVIPPKPESTTEATHISPPPPPPLSPANFRPIVRWFQAERVTRVFSSPDERSNTVTTISPGMRIRAVGELENWLEIRSRQGRPPGYIRRTDVREIDYTE